MKRRQFLKKSAAISSVSFFMHACSNTKKSKPNVLFIAVDDLRPEFGCYGKTNIISPNLDKLAKMGTTFTRAYCNVPVCGASRASLLTGLRPSSNRFTFAHTQAERDVPTALSIQTHFKNNGYHTVSNGKIYQHITDYVNGWSERPWRPNGEWWGWQAYVSKKSFAQIREQREKGVKTPGPFYAVEKEPAKYHALPGYGLVKSGPSTECAEVNDNRYPDGMVADKVIDDIQRLKNKERPFFITAGFVKPHLPFAAPKKYWDLYDRDKISLAENPFAPNGAPDEALHNWPELRSYSDIPKTGRLSNEKARELIHGYYACTSYVDAQIGRIMDELEKQKLIDNTIIVLWGDHGWNLGEHGLWCKHCNFETSLHSPLLVYAPGFSKAQRLDQLTEFVDIYPSLCELCGIPIPTSLHGDSFVSIMKNPQNSWKTAVFSRYENGESIKTDRYRYTEFYDESERVVSSMLYDHKTDPHENTNVVHDSSYSDTVSLLSQKLQSHIQKFKEI